MKVMDDLVLREIAGTYILVPVGAAATKIQGMISLNGSGVLLWKRLQEECSEAELVDALLAEYDVDRATAVADVREFLQKMRDADLLR